MLLVEAEARGFAITSESLDALWRSHAPGVAVFIARRTLDAGVAADLTAETFAQAYTKRHQFRGASREAAVGWLYAIARHQVSHYVRRHRAEARALRAAGHRAAAAPGRTSCGASRTATAAASCAAGSPRSCEALSPSSSRRCACASSTSSATRRWPRASGSTSAPSAPASRAAIRTLASRLAPEVRELHELL